jgi:hypothetical protein
VDKPSEIRLHIGAHKTATTHLQTALNANKRHILQSGCVYLSTQFVRKIGLLKGVHSNHWETSNPSDKFHSLEQFFVIPEGYPKRILISEEDVLGLSIDLLEGIYPRAKSRLAPWAALAGGDAMQIFLSVRDYATILPSAYSQALRDGFSLIPFEGYTQHWIRTRPSWVRMIHTIVEIFGASRLTVWTTEYYSERPGDVLYSLSGAELSEFPLPAPEGTRRLSAGAVKEIQQLDPSLSRAARRLAVQELLRHEDSTDVFDPLSQTDKALLSDWYRSDLECIARMGVTFLG